VRYEQFDALGRPEGVTGYASGRDASA